MLLAKCGCLVLQTEFCVLWSQGLCSHWAVHLNLVLLFPSFHFFLGSKHNADAAVLIDVILSFYICIHLETLNVDNNWEW